MSAAPFEETVPNLLTLPEQHANQATYFLRLVLGRRILGSSDRDTAEKGVEYQLMRKTIRPCVHTAIP